MQWLTCKSPQPAASAADSSLQYPALCELRSAQHTVCDELLGEEGLVGTVRCSCLWTPTWRISPTVLASKSASALRAATLSCCEAGFANPACMSDGGSSDHMCHLRNLGRVQQSYYTAREKSDEMFLHCCADQDRSFNVTPGARLHPKAGHSTVVGPQFNWHDVQEYT
jgi:hypothetical protein